ncbi:MAG: phosphatase [Ignavibacteriae bacterium]|nr:MAG: phosphatase [Ignavibacteriota bacterium]
MPKVDLHTHTIYSDGSLYPEELLNLAKERGISTIGITDHDTVNGIEEALIHGEKIGVEVIPGIEISTCVEDIEIHLLGYFFDFKSSDLINYLNFFNKARKERAKSILKKLKEYNINLTISDVEEFSKNSPICRPHIAKAMEAKGYVKNFFTAFKEYLGDNKSAYEKKVYVSPKNTVDIIHQAGGLVFLAHPGKMKETILQEIINSGIDGVETIHPSHKKVQQKYYKNIVKQYSLLESGGSDFHGGDRNDKVNFGKYFTTISNLDKMKKYLNL